MHTHTHTHTHTHSTTTELNSLLYGPRMNEKRETLFEDRTRCHADHVDHGFTRDTTAAVGLLKAVKFGDERCVSLCVSVSVCVCVSVSVCVCVSVSVCV